MRKNVIMLLLGLLLMVAACTQAAQTTETPVDMRQHVGDEEQYDVADWRLETLTDVNTGEEFTIFDFAGQPILVESFALWCPTCTKQQNILKELHQVNPEVVSIGLDTDQNEDAEKVRAHTEKYGFDWRYAVAPLSTTQMLIEEFGTGILNAPSVPIILICPNGMSRLLDRGLKDVAELQAEIGECDA